MLSAITLFNDSFIRIQKIDSLYTFLTTQQKLKHEDVEDLLRSEIVYAISALDRLIHDLVKFGMVEIFINKRPSTDAYKKFQLPLEQISFMSSTSILPPEAILEQWIINAHKHLAFQEPDKINSALNLISNTQYKWQVIAGNIGLSESDTKTMLKNIVIRRNQIVHESDLDLSTGQIQNLLHADTITSVNFVKDIGTHIYNMVK